MFKPLLNSALHLYHNPENEIMVLEAGDCFGEWGIMSKQGRTGSVVCLEDTDLFVLDQEAFKISFFRCIQKAEQDRRNFLCTMIKPLSGLAERKLDYILKFFTTKYFKKGEIVYEQGAPADAFYLIFEGKAEVNKKNKGKQLRLLIADKGDFLGIESLEKEKYEYTAIMRSNFSVLMIFKKSILGDIKAIVYDFLVEINRQKSQILQIHLEKKLKRAFELRKQLDEHGLREKKKIRFPPVRLNHLSRFPKITCGPAKVLRISRNSALLPVRTSVVNRSRVASINFVTGESAKKERKIKEKSVKIDSLVQKTVRRFGKHSRNYDSGQFDLPLITTLNTIE